MPEINVYIYIYRLNLNNSITKLQAFSHGAFVYLMSNVRDKNCVAWFHLLMLQTIGASGPFAV